MIEFLQRNWKYVKYLFWHKAYVYQAGRITGAPIYRLIIHDWSKLMPVEWFAYLNFFYPTVEMNPELKLAFRLAFNHHLHWNKHHWQYWAISSDDGKTRAQEMPEKYIREMVADWFGAGKGISDKWDADVWYTQHNDMLLASKTRRRVEELLKSTAKVLNANGQA